ncbi:MAG: DUF4388 domain-containing protein [Planctomycetota bacterium]
MSELQEYVRDFLASGATAGSRGQPVPRRAARGTAPSPAWLPGYCRMVQGLLGELKQAVRVLAPGQLTPELLTDLRQTAEAAARFCDAAGFGAAAAAPPATEPVPLPFAKAAAEAAADASPSGTAPTAAGPTAAGPAGADPAGPTPPPGHPPVLHLLEELKTCEEAMDGRPLVLQGTNNSLSLTSVFSFLGAGRKSGTLHVGTYNERIVFDFADGEVVCARSDAPPPDQRLGAILVARGDISPQTLELALAEHSGLEQLGARLQRQEILSASQLMAALQLQAQECFYRAFTAEQISYGFFEGELTTSDQLMRMRVPELLLQSARARDELDEREAQANDKARASAAPEA